MSHIKWFEMSDGRVQGEHPAGFTVIKPSIDAETVPLFCPVCEMTMTTADDSQSYRKYECCRPCACRWAEWKTEWSDGWRPSSQEIQEDLARRHARPFTIRF